MRDSRKFMCFLAIFGSLLCWLPLVSASDQFCADPEAIFTGCDAHPWERVELLRDGHPGFKQEAFSPQGEQLDPSIRKWFRGDASPHSKYVLLHCAKGYAEKSFPNPVLLVHGAGDNANRGWIHPKDPVMPKELPFDRQGFAVHLSTLGYSVFAVTFSHNQGCNIMQSEQIANAIRRIRTLLNRDADPNFQVDIVAHSKGNVAVRLYCSDSREIFPQKTFLSHYRKDVRKFIAIASPMLGIDTAFRYYAYNLTLASKGNLNAPFGCDRLLYQGFWKTVAKLPGETMDEKPEAVDGSRFYDAETYFPGQFQLLYNLVKDADQPLGLESMTPFDLNYTAEVLYHGGGSTVITSRGIERAIDAGERLIYRLEKKGIDPSIYLGVIAGGNPHITWYVDGIGYIPMPHEVLSAPMDGVLFVKSATHTDGILSRGAKLLGKEVLNLNHLGVASRAEAFRLVDDWLRETVAIH